MKKRKRLDKKALTSEDRKLYQEAVHQLTAVKAECDAAKDNLYNVLSAVWMFLYYSREGDAMRLARAKEKLTAMMNSYLK